MSTFDGSISGDEGLQQLQELHRTVEQAVQRAVEVYSALQLSSARSPQRGDLVAVFEQTHQIASAVAGFLDGLDRALANEGSEVAVAPLSADQVRKFLLAVEMPPTGAVSRVDPCVPRRTTPLGQLPSFYRYHVGLDNELHRRRAPRSFAWRESMLLWQTLTYHGGAYAAGGLLSRLDHISDVRESRRAPRTSNAHGVVTQGPGGQRVLTLGAQPPPQSYPWDRSDIAALHSVARRARLFATASGDALFELERSQWCAKIDAELEVAHSPDEQRVALAMLIDDLPADDPAVRERVTRLTGLAHLDDDTRARLQAWLSGTPLQSPDEAEPDAGPVFPSPSALVRVDRDGRLASLGILVLGAGAAERFRSLQSRATADPGAAPPDPRFAYTRMALQHSRAGKLLLHLYALATDVAEPATVADVLPHMSGIVVVQPQLDDSSKPVLAAAEQLARSGHGLPTAVLTVGGVDRAWARITGAEPVYVGLVSHDNVLPALAMVMRSILETPGAAGPGNGGGSAPGAQRRPWWKVW